MRREYWLLFVRGVHPLIGSLAATPLERKWNVAAASWLGGREFVEGEE